MRRSSFILTAAAAGLLAPPSPLRAQTPLHAHVGTPGQDGNAGVYYGADMGFFKTYGLDVEIETIRRGSGAGIVAAVTGRSLDVGEADIIAIATALEHGIPLTILWPSQVYSSSSPTSTLLVAASSPLRTAKDLEGKTMALASLEGAGRIATDRWLERNGADRTALKFVEIPRAEMVASLDRGTVDAALASEPNVAEALASGKARTLAHTYDAIGKRFVTTAWFSSAAWVRDSPAAASAFVKGLRDAQVWANRNRDKSAVIYQKYSQISIETILTMPRSTLGESADLALFQPMIDAAVAEKALPAPIVLKDTLSSVTLALRR